jgi:hypothetical protein
MQIHNFFFSLSPLYSLEIDKLLFLILGSGVARTFLLLYISLGLVVIIRPFAGFLAGVIEGD